MSLIPKWSWLPTNADFSAAGKILRQLFREFRAPLAIATLWTVYNLDLASQPFGKWLYSSSIDKWFVTFFAISFWFAQWNRVKKQVRVEEGLTGIEGKVAEMLDSLETKTNHLLSHITGGDSFCYAYPQFIGPNVAQWIFIHSGKFPLYDVKVRVCDLRISGPNMGYTLDLGTLFPGRALSNGSLTAGILDRAPVQAFNLFFVARNGSWTQEIRWVEKPSALAMANRVVRDGDKLTDPLLCEISPEYQGDTPSDDAWNTLPPGLMRNA